MQLAESYKLNRQLIQEDGHPYLVFMDGDTLGIQLTQGMRSFINRAGKGAKMRFVLRMGYSMLAPYDTLYYDHVNDDGDSVYIFMDYPTYSRYDFSDYISQPMNMKIWLATKRGDDE
jgi:translation elongation factor P/translation initiation factor 5A